MEVQLDFADGTVTVLSDDQVGDILNLWIVWFVIAWTVDKADDVGVLLNGSGFTQVGQLWNWWRARLDGTAQLTQGDQRHVEFASDQL